VERAIDHEIERQARALDAGETLLQETRGWDDDRGVTYRMRVKESSDDYRYFPEPDLPPFRPDTAWLDEVRSGLPELPAARRARYTEQLGLSAYDATVLVGDRAATALFEGALASDPTLPAKRLANWVTGEYLRLAKSGESAAGSGTPSVNPAELGRLVAMVERGELSGTNAKEVFARHVDTGEGVATIVAALGLRQISDESGLLTAIDAVLAANPDAAADVRAGKSQALGFLTGQVMKETRGQANAALVGKLLRERLEAS
jgi:aspartyl-tRNA(Asn)/glutamyl-tRNA(Gln) amidotransferase subunit B